MVRCLTILFPNENSFCMNLEEKGPIRKVCASKSLFQLSEKYINKASPYLEEGGIIK
jgi:hypothetical protein